LFGRARQADTSIAKDARRRSWEAREMQAKKEKGRQREVRPPTQEDANLKPATRDNNSKTQHYRFLFT